MRTRRMAYIAAVAISATLLMPSQAQAARSMTGEGGGLSVFVRIEDTAFTGPDCIRVPVTVRYTGTGVLQLNYYLRGSSAIGTDFIFLRSDDGRQESDLQICPFLDGAGTYLVDGVVEGDDGRGTLTEGQFTVSRAQASVTQLSATQRGSIVTFKGRVSAVTPRGRIGVNTEVVLRGRLPKSQGGTGEWRRIGSASADQFGRFKVKGSTTQNLRGATILAEASTSAWASSASSSTIVR